MTLAQLRNEIPSSVFRLSVDSQVIGYIAADDMADALIKGARMGGLRRRPANELKLHRLTVGEAMKLKNNGQNFLELLRPVRPRHHPAPAAAPPSSQPPGRRQTAPLS